MNVLAHRTHRLDWRALAFALLIGLILGVAAPAQAQFKPTVSSPKALPSGLHWQMMPEVSLNFEPKFARAKPAAELVESAKTMWADEIAKQLKASPNSPMHVLLTTAQVADRSYTFSILYLPFDFERCEQPLNGKDVTDMYGKCLMRVATMEGQKTQAAQFQDFCYLYIDFDPQTPLAQNHTEIAVDAAAGIAYFRVIQHGKPVPACYRAVRLS